MQNVALVLFIVQAGSPTFVRRDCEMVEKSVNKTVDIFEAQG